MSTLQKILFPFIFLKTDDECSVSFGGEDFKGTLFKDLGLSCSGYEWEQIVNYFIYDVMPDIAEDVDYDCESGMFCIFSKNYKALKRFALAFRKVWDNETLLSIYIKKAFYTDVSELQPANPSETPKHGGGSFSALSGPTRSGKGVSSVIPTCIDGQNKIILQELL